MSKVNNSDIKEAFIPKMNFAWESIQNCFEGDNLQVDKSEKYLKLIQELHAQMIIALKNNNT